MKCTHRKPAIGIWQQLEPHLPQNVQLHCIKLYETPRIYVEYFWQLRTFTAFPVITSIYHLRKSGSSMAETFLYLNFRMNNKVAVYRKEHFNAAHRLQS